MSWTAMMHDMMRDIKHIMREQFQSLKEKNQYVVPIAIGACVAFAIAGLCYGYFMHMRQKEYAAQQILAECIDEYNRVRQGSGEWANVELMCKAGYERFAATKTAAYFMVFRADALLALDQPEAAIQLLQQMLERLGSSSPLYALFKTKLSLIKIDDHNPRTQEEGVQELKELAADANNIQRDVALYYLEHYYAAHNQPEAAQATLAELQALQPLEHSAQSPWVVLAQEASNNTQR